MEELSLRGFQVADLAYYMATPRCGNFSDPGTGKTPPTCVYLWWYWSEHRKRSIWTMPKSLLKKNRVELLAWGGFKDEDVVIVDSYSAAARLKRMKTDAKVFLMGFRCFADNWRQLVEIHPDIDLLAGDEWHMGFKGDGSQRTQSLKEFMRRTTRLVAMTGTIIDGRLDTIYPLLEICAPGHYIGGYEGFMMAHAVEDEGGRVVAWRNQARLAPIVKQIAIRHSFEEVYGPEAKVIVVEPCEMSPQQAEAYKEFEEAALLELENEWLRGDLPGVNQIRCRQLMEHPQAFGPPLDTIKYTGKEEQLLIHLEDHKRTGKPLVIFAAFQKQHDRLAKICRDMGFRVGLINGQVPAKTRFSIDEDFRAGLYDVIVASAATAGVGFNWGHVDHIIFMSLDPMDSNFVQAYRRAVRGVRERPLLITVMRYTDSRVETRIFEIVEAKSALANTVDETKERIFLRNTDRNKKAPASDIPETFVRPSMANFISRNQVR